MSSELSSNILEVNGLTKKFGGTTALDHAVWTLHRGEIHAIAGENGAGKSTLCKMLAGAIVPTEGTITIDGKTFHRLNPSEAKRNGIVMIYQEFNLVPELPIYENVFLGKEITNHGITVDKVSMIKKTDEIFNEMGVKVDSKAIIADISVAYCQLVEIAKALLENAKILIMDEPTAPLTNQEVGILFDIIGRLKKRGITIIYISHRMEEIFQLADRVTIMRDGKIITVRDITDIDQKEIISLMVGHELGMDFPERGKAVRSEQPLLSVRNLTTEKIKNISFELYGGEILGFAGLVGAGRTEIVRALFGADKVKSGEVYLHGKKVDKFSISGAIKNKIGLIPEDRKRQGVHLELPILHNMSILQLGKISKLLTINRKKEKANADEYTKKLRIKMGSMMNEVSSLSGGNQQKVVLAKWLANEPDILFFDEPTRGIDVGAKAEIYELMDELRSQGKAIIMISSEMPEVLGMCDRILVLYEGQMMGEVSGENTTQDEIMTLASGIQLDK